MKYLTMSTIEDSRLDARRVIAIVIFCVLQIAAYIAALSAAADTRSPLIPWPTVVTFGMVIAQCALAASFAVFGFGRFFVRVFDILH